VAGEELATARPREANEVLEVRTGSRDRAGDSGIKWSAHRGQEQDSGDARADLEAAVGDVLLRDPIAREVKEQPERQGAEPRPDERAASRACRDVEGDDQAPTLAWDARRSDRSDAASRRTSWPQTPWLVVAEAPKGDTGPSSRRERWQGSLLG
jgi:hypothetical protein